MLMNRNSTQNKVSICKKDVCLNGNSIQTDPTSAREIDPTSAGQTDPISAD